MQFIRQAGFNERRCITRDDLHLYGTITTLGTYTNDRTAVGAVEEGTIYQALKQCMIEHPILGVVVQDAGTEKPWLARPPTIDLIQHVHILDAVLPGQENVQTVLERIHSIPRSGYEQKPQWDVYVVPRKDREFYLAIACSHALFDGRSLFLFQHTFLQALNSIGKSTFDGEPVFDVSEHRTILPPLELAGKLAISWSFLLGPLLNEYMPAWLLRALRLGTTEQNTSAQNPLWTGAAIRPAKPPGQLPRTAVHVAQLSWDALRDVLTICRARNARLTALLAHTCARASASALKAQGASYRMFKVSTALDLRRCLPEHKDEMANYVSTVSETVHADSADQPMSDEDWTEVRTMTARLHQASSTLSDQPAGLLRYLSNYREWTLKRSQAAADTSFEISNLGILDSNNAPEDGMKSKTWTIEEMAFSQSADGTGPPFNLNVASVSKGPLSLVLSWWPGMLGVQDERRLAEEVCDGIVYRLEHLGD